jgi:hypothetical protein
MFSFTLPGNFNPIGSVTRWAFAARHIAENFRSFSKYIHMSPRPCFGVIVTGNPRRFAGLMGTNFFLPEFVSFSNNHEKLFRLRIVVNASNFPTLI